MLILPPIYFSIYKNVFNFTHYHMGLWALSRHRASVSSHFKIALGGLFQLLSFNGNRSWFQLCMAFKRTYILGVDTNKENIYILKITSNCYLHEKRSAYPGQILIRFLLDSYQILVRLLLDSCHFLIRFSLNSCQILSDSPQTKFKRKNSTQFHAHLT